jgi:hypothetical protein
MAAQQQAACSAALLACGGDLKRMIDSPAGALPFLAHLRRLIGMLEAVRPPIVLLTAVTPLVAQVVLLRERFEAELPPLRRADWLLFVDESTRSFVSEALRIGKFERAAGVAIWQHGVRARYLVVSADSKPGELAGAMLALRPPEPHDPLRQPSRGSLRAPRRTSRPPRALRDLKR